MRDSCQHCGSLFDCISFHKDGNYERKYRKKFCSRKCAASRSWDEEKKARHSAIAKSLPTYKPAKLVERICPCGKKFMVRPCLKKKHCCHPCSSKYRPKYPGMGGYREGSGRSKSGYYKGIYCGSTYELCWVIYRLDKGLPFKRFEGLLEKGDLKYFPDFLVGNNQIIEIKGYWTEAVNKKKTLAESLGYKVKILYKEDLKHIFHYVKEKYGTDKFQTLYDDHKPNYVGTCCYCKKEFSSERKKPKTKDVFCSRTCCGKYRKIKNTPCR